ncbi:polysaccharide biosynthesis/export family protein [Aureimonas psammosilenae]|uniref:polysaccharide biosynthesis/export family protein n=1 Tax=Aureimonas psammosilenae TaxID=2495496 RepID=UPI001260D61F|nr:polysaccharide biosynthesis/export family protein [Aureimonas psammosilenae]
MVFAPRKLAVSGLALLLGLAGCSGLPSSGPDKRDIKSQAAVRVGYPDRKVGIDYVLLDLNKEALSYFQHAEKTSLKNGFGGGRGGAPETVLGPGDIVQVSIFEAATGGLFIPEDAGSRPGNYVTLPQQTVDRAGTISVPYAGRIRASGRTTTAVQAEIENLLANRAIEPQVLVTIVENRSSQVSVLGDVKEPAKLELNPSGERVLDVIARAGGLSTPGVETYVTLQRRGKEGTVLFSDLIENPTENIFVATGDTVYVNRERRTFLAFGASGLNGRIDFEESNLTLGEALGKAGGLLDGRADPAQLLLYRTMDRSLLTRMRVDVSRFSGSEVPVIIRANMRDPASFFAVQKLPMQDKDILYVSNSDSTEVLKFLNIVNSVTSSASGATGDFVSTRTSVRDF